jgi:hypothetical protein
MAVMNAEPRTPAERRGRYPEEFRCDSSATGLRSCVNSVAIDFDPAEEKTIPE